MIVGTNRVNAQVVLDALARQTCPDAVVELVVFDCAALSNPALETAVSCSPTTAAGGWWQIANAAGFAWQALRFTR
jgi:hypothetical protein